MPAATLIAHAIRPAPGGRARRLTDRVLLVHGYRGNPSNRADLKSVLEAQGRTVAAIDLPSQDNAFNAKAAERVIAAAEAPRRRPSPDREYGRGGRLGG